MTRDEYRAARDRYRSNPKNFANPDAPASASQPKETAMAKAAKTEDGAHEVQPKDFAEAVKIYRQDIKPAKTKQGEFGQEQSTAYKAIKKNCHIQPQAAKLAFNVSEMEDAHRDDFLICLNGLFRELGIVMPRDLVTMADGDAGGEVIPIGERKRPQLATLQYDGDNSDLADAGEDDDAFTEASEEELAGQEPRAGTGAAAIKAMRQAMRERAAEADAESEREAAE